MPFSRFVVVPQLALIKNNNSRTECERGTVKLTEEDVDIGLFLLGRQFDQAMRQLLEVARDHAGMLVKKDHIKSLGNRISWAVNHKLFHDEAALKLLENERSERSHETVSIDEHRAIMKFAPYLAGLYLDYLLLIEQKIQSFRQTKHLRGISIPQQP